MTCATRSDDSVSDPHVLDLDYIIILVYFLDAAIA